MRILGTTTARDGCVAVLGAHGKHILKFGTQEEADAFLDQCGRLSAASVQDRHGDLRHFELLQKYRLGKVTLLVIAVRSSSVLFMRMKDGRQIEMDVLRLAEIADNLDLI